MGREGYMKKKENILPAVMMIGVIACMCAVSEILKDREIIFPEIAALALGYLCAPKRSWQVNSIRMFFCISLCAVLGLCISIWMPGTLYLKLVTAYIIAQIIFLFSGTTLAPLISAVVLPVLIRSKSISYVLSASLMCALVILLHAFLVRKGIRQAEPYHPVEKPDGMRLTKMAIRTMVMALVAAAAVVSDWLFLIAPPILVAFTELSENWTPASSLKPWKVILLLSGCAAGGGLCRYFLTVRLGLPLTFSAVPASVIMCVLVYRTEMFMPPAGAMTLLAMLVPQQAVLLYPIEACLGISIYMLSTIGMYRLYHPHTI